MNKKIKLAIMALGLSIGVNAPFTANAWTCQSLCDWASQVCASDPGSFDCMEAKRDCRFCYVP